MKLEYGVIIKKLTTPDQVRIDKEIWGIHISEILRNLIICQLYIIDTEDQIRPFIWDYFSELVMFGEILSAFEVVMD